MAFLLTSLYFGATFCLFIYGVQCYVMMALFLRRYESGREENGRIEADGAELGSIRQYFNPFVLKYDVDFSMDAAGALDRRVGLALAVLLLAIEGRQE